MLWNARLHYTWHLNRAKNFLSALCACMCKNMTCYKYVSVGTFIHSQPCRLSSRGVCFCACPSERTYLLESLAHSEGSNPIWSRREMFHCSDTTQTQGLFLLARVQPAPLCLCVCVRVLLNAGQCTHRLIRKLLQLLNVGCDERVKIS